MTNDCKTCPVSTGTHKPAEAVHQIHEPTDQPEALRYADAICAGLSYTSPHILALAADELRAQHARIAELEQRLEIDPRHRYDGISARDATIEAQDERIAELESQLKAIGAGGVEPLRKRAAAQQGVQPDAFKQVVDRAHYWLRTMGYHRDEDFFVNVNRVGAEAIHVSTIAAIAKVAAATQPAAQGMEADLTDEQIYEAFNQMPDGAAGHA